MRKGDFTGESAASWRQRRDSVGGAQSEQAMGVRASYPERERVCEPRKAEFEAECHARVTQWACVYVGTRRALQRARQRLCLRNFMKSGFGGLKFHELSFHLKFQSWGLIHG